MHDEPDELEIAEREWRREKQKQRRKRHLAAPCPRDAPDLSVVSSMYGIQTLRFYHNQTPMDAIRPYGAAAVQLAVATAAEPFAPLSAARIIGEYKRNPIRVEFGRDADGKRATYYGRWVSPRGEKGPWSQPACMTIAG